MLLFSISNVLHLSIQKIEFLVFISSSLMIISSHIMIVLKVIVACFGCISLHFSTISKFTLYTNRILEHDDEYQNGDNY